MDDLRPTPPGWVRVYWPEEAISLLQTGQVRELSLDHDLGDDDHGTGYDVLLWMEEQVVTQGWQPPPLVHIHSANAAGVQKMRAALASIRRHCL